MYTADILYHITALVVVLPFGKYPNSMSIYGLSSLAMSELSSSKAATKSRFGSSDPAGASAQANQRKKNGSRCGIFSFLARREFNLHVSLLLCQYMP
jgi:hypothetical protein